MLTTTDFWVGVLVGVAAYYGIQRYRASKGKS